MSSRSDTRSSFVKVLVTMIPALALFATANGAATHIRRAANDLANVEVLIVRHAERQGEEDKLTPAGIARAEAYAHYFNPLKLGGRTIRLTHLIAEKSKRTRGTIEPLSRATGLPLDTRFTNKQVQGLADDLRHHSYGREILICWHHGRIPALIAAFGGKPDVLIPGGKWPKSTYDWIIDLRFDASGKLTAARVPEHLMPGDSK